MHFALAMMLLIAAPADAKKPPTTPSLQVDKWANLPDGQDSMPLDGKVTVVLGFSHWCGACHQFGIPVHQALEAVYADQAEVQFAYVQPDFGNLPGSAFRLGLMDIEKAGLNGAYGMEYRKGELPPALVGKYGMQGTPWTLVIGPDGRVLYSDFTTEPETLVNVISAGVAKAQAGS